MVAERPKHEAAGQQVVSVNHILGDSFAAQLTDLESRFIPSLQLASPESAFIHFIFAQLPEQCRPPALPAPVVPASIAEGVAPALATVGFLSAIDGAPDVQQLHQEWRTSFTRLQNKDPFPTDRQTFALRPIEFFGICVGARHAYGQQSNEVAWLLRLLPEQRRRIQGLWSHLLSSAASAALADRDDARITVDIASLQTDELSLMLWLRESQSFAVTGFWRSLAAKELEHALLQHCAVHRIDFQDPARSAILYAALKMSVLSSLRSELDQRWQLGRTRSDVLDLLTTVFRRFHRTARQILERHADRDTLKIKDEYDVQDLVHALLLLFFDDVRP